MNKQDWRKKRRSTEGSIKNVKGYLYARIQWIDETTGKRKEKLRRAVNRTEARKLIKEMVSELENHGEETLQSDKLTFAELAEKYEATKLVAATYANGIKITGKRSLLPSKSALKPLIEHFGRKTIRAIKTSDIETYKTKRLNAPVEIEINVKAEIVENGKKKVVRKKEMRTRPRKISSVNREIEHLRAVFNFAKDDGLLIKTPFEGKGKGKSLIVKAAENERNRILSSEEEQRLFDASGARTTTYTRNGKEITMHDSGDSRRHLRALIMVAVDTGARRGELFKLQWKDVNLISKQLTIQASNAKTEKSRIIGITSRSKIELEKLWKASPKNNNDLVFGISSTIKNAWKSLCNEAGIDDLHFHDLRHTATTRLIRAGVPHTEVMKITGHTQIKTFLRYLNMTNDSLANSTNMLDAYISNQKTGFNTVQLSNTVN